MKNVLLLYPFYPYNRQYVALCVPSSNPIVFKCQDGYVADLSTIPVTCNFKCKAPGLFPNQDDSTKYFECYYNSKRQLVMRSGNCFPGYVFVTDRCQIQSSVAPTVAPTDAPTEAPTDGPTNAPTDGPTDAPTDGPTDAPTDGPTNAPTDGPTNAPTDTPTDAPTDAPTNGPTEAPTDAPTDSPTDEPTNAPTTTCVKAPCP
ncbi:uncharacterized protein [Chironomus tepperi]|uniref:uncharacterized protein n=1 Tax=Chironomus tepperi TaxID=113505 RepID=UPI00391F5D9A